MKPSKFNLAKFKTAYYAARKTTTKDVETKDCAINGIEEINNLMIGAEPIVNFIITASQQSYIKEFIENGYDDNAAGGFASLITKFGDMLFDEESIIDSLSEKEEN